MKLTLNEIINYDIGDINDLYTASGLTELDRFAGWARNGLNLILAASGRGKSMISLYSAAELSKDANNAILYLSLENSAKTDLYRLQKFLQTTYQGQLLYVNADLNDINVTTITNTIKTFKLDNADKNCYVYIDSIDFIHEDGDAAEMFNKYGHIAANLTALAREQEITIITTQQLNRSAADKPLEEQTYFMIQQSIGIAQKASVILIGDMFYLDAAFRKQSGQIAQEKQVPSYKIDKLRDGPKGYTFWNPNFICHIEDLKKKLNQ